MPLQSLSYVLYRVPEFYIRATRTNTSMIHHEADLKNISISEHKHFLHF
uniref:Uncharacterized protein n=1 Tax=Arundo donax TaxID=35708 RepID=A0A0A9H051_ARUDO